MVNKSKILSNLSIKAEQVRLISEDSKSSEVIELSKALELANERNLDLIQITDKSEIPICKIINLGKYLYNLDKKDKKSRKRVKTTSVKIIKISFKISEHDMNTSAERVRKFLEKGDKVKIEIVLKGREKYLDDFWKKKILKFLEIIQELVDVKKEKELKKEGQGANLVISKI